jgi:poly(hydroxyalkanoate) depolymerase family esterase
MNPLRALWQRVRGFFAGLFRRKPAEPGRFVAATKLSWRGFIGTTPWIAPQREYLVYVPMGNVARWRWRRRPLVVLLHGCKQSPEEISGGARIARLADAAGFLVLLPRQNPHANAWGCWNWFDGPTTRGWGEAAIVAAQIREVRRSYRIDKRRVFVAGMSSGGGLAAIMGVRHPNMVAGVFVHSGVSCGAASSPSAALGVLSRGADTDIERLGREARAGADENALPVPLCVIQGGADNVVAPVNAAQLVRQYLALNAHPAADQGAADALPVPDRAATAITADGRNVTTSEWRVGDRVVARHVLVDALGHAWSGGDEAFGYNDAHGPDATELLATFVRDAVR